VIDDDDEDTPSRIFHALVSDSMLISSNARDWPAPE
jgi:hypothetical protein